MRVKLQSSNGLASAQRAEAPVRPSWRRTRPSRSARSPVMILAIAARQTTSVTAPSPDAAWFRREVLPKLSAYPLDGIPTATGLSLTACSRIRAGSQIPHPQHGERWFVLDPR
jgi:hypothetical protein